MQQDEGLNPAPKEEEPRSRHRYRSLFWAIVLIGVGAVWLLFNLDIISPASLGVLTYVWPILIIGIGVDLLIGRRSPALGALVGVVTVGLIIVLMLLGSTLSWAGDPDLKTQTFSTSVGQATSAQVSLATGGYSAKVHAIEVTAVSDVSAVSDRPLLQAVVTYRGLLNFESTGDQEKMVVLESKRQSWWWQFFDSEEPAPWDIGLDPGTPLDLNVKSASGSCELDLSGLRLTDLEVDVSSGSARVVLPALGAQSYGVALDLSSGDMKVEAAAGARIDMNVDMSSGDVRVALGKESDVTVTFEGSSGEFTLDLPAGQALRIEVKKVSSGDVKMPSGLVQVEQGDDEEGVWETQGYAAAAHKVHLIVEKMSSGSVDINLGG